MKNKLCKVITNHTKKQILLLFFIIYYTNTGLRNARLNFRQLEETHLMEKVMYNELCLRGYAVDVGMVEINERQADGKYVKKQIEVDFVCNKFDERVYVQSVFSIPTTKKRLQEERPLANVGDGFRKVVLTKDNVLGTTTRMAS